MKMHNNKLISLFLKNQTKHNFNTPIKPNYAQLLKNRPMKVKVYKINLDFKVQPICCGQKEVNHDEDGCFSTKTEC